MPAKVINNGTNINELLDPFAQGVKRLFVLAYDATDDDEDVGNIAIKSKRDYFLPRACIKNHNVLIDGNNFAVQPFNDLIKQQQEVRKVVLG